LAELKCIDLVTCFKCEKRFQKCLAEEIRMLLSEEDADKKGVAWVSDDFEEDEDGTPLWDATVWMCEECAEEFHSES